MKYQQLDQEELFRIAALRMERLGVREIAKRLCRSASTISREVRGNSYPTHGHYRLSHAGRMGPPGAVTEPANEPYTAARWKRVVPSQARLQPGTDFRIPAQEGLVPDQSRNDLPVSAHRQEGRRKPFQMAALPRQKAAGGNATELTTALAGRRAKGRLPSARMERRTVHGSGIGKSTP